MTSVEEPTTGVVALLLDDLAPPRLGTLLRCARKHHSLTRREVASRVGTTPSDLRRFERGDAPVPPSIVAALAECYGEDLTAQFATRVPIQLDRRRIVVGTEEASVHDGEEDEDDVLNTYVGIVARLRHAKPGEPIALRTDDLVALSTALGRDPERVEARIVELLGCTPREARSLHSELLRRKLVLPVAGLVTGLAVVTGVGVSVAAASPGSAPVHSDQAALIASPAPASQAVATPTTVAAAPTTTVAPAVAPAAAPDPVPVAAATTTAPTTPPAAAPAAPTTEVTPAATPAKAPVIKPDNTPMGIPPNETVTIISP